MANLGTFLILAAFVVASGAFAASLAGARRDQRSLIEGGTGLSVLEIDGERALAPRVEMPGIVHRAFGVSRRHHRDGAVGIAFTWLLDLDDVGAIVAEHGGGDRRRNERGDIQDADA